jgi:hypothetical protein
VQDFQLTFSAPCSSTANPTVGADCGLSTTADAAVPGLIKESQRMLMESLDPVRVYDGGADEDADTLADNTLFLTQGIFVP